MIKNKAFKFRLVPNSTQEVLIQKTFGCCRFVFNKMLGDKISAYQNDKINLNVNPSMYKSEFEFLKEVDSLALCQEWNHLNSAYNNFFRGIKKHQVIGFPKFKSKKHSKKSYTTCIASKNALNVRIEDNYIILPKIGKVKFKKSREVVGKVKSATVSQSASGKYFVSILTEYEFEEPKIKLNLDNSLGLDYSSHDFFVDSQSNKANYPRFFRIYEEKLAKEQRKLSRMKYDSNNYRKQRIKVAKVHEKISNSRLDFLHKLSTDLANTYDIICVEDINLRGMSQLLTLGKSTMDNGFGMFRTFLSYKLEDRGKLFVKINKWDPTTIVCSSCGCYHKDIVNNLSVREWVCPDCNTKHDRDINAAKNIRALGLQKVVDKYPGLGQPIEPVDTENVSSLEQEGV